MACRHHGFFDLLIRQLAAMVTLTALATLVASSQAASSQDRPSFTVQLAFRDGRLVVDAQRSTLQLGGQNKVFEDCGLTPAVISSQLVQRLDGLYGELGSVFELIAVPPVGAADGDPAATERRTATLGRLRALAQADEATRRLLNMAGPWGDNKADLRAWGRTHAGAEPPVVTAEPVFDDLYKQARSLAGLLDSPLLPLQRDRDDIDSSEFEAGRIVYLLAPPLVPGRGLLRPVSNVAQWDAVRSGLGDDALDSLRCRLWNRQPVLDAVQDYLAVRGHRADAYRNERDAAARLGVADPPVQAAPDHHAGITPERTRYADPRPGQPPEFGGRVLLLPDPLVRTVFIQIDPGTPPAPQALPWKALYLLLPTADFARVRATPGRYLCSTQAVWKNKVAGQAPPPALRLDLDVEPGRSLDFAGLYLTQRELAQRLQRLTAIGQTAGVNFTRTLQRERRRDTVLIIEPLSTEEAGAGRPAAGATTTGRPTLAGIYACPETSAAPTSVAAVTGDNSVARTEQPRDVAEPARDSADSRGRRTADSPKPRRNELQFSIDKAAGKPASLGVLYTRQGLQPNDHFSIGFGHHRQSSAEGRYSSDFVAFDTLQRRLQLAAAITRTPQPDRPNDSGRSDERRDGAELAATLDLWRDHAGTFGQTRLALARARVTPAGGSQALPEVNTLRTETTVVAQRPLSAAAPYSEGMLTLGRGRAAGAGFGIGGVELRHQRFVGAFDRIDLHLVAAGVGAGAPRSEWLPFGGEDTVRGWRDETVLTRRGVALQAEVWTRVPWAPSSAALAQLFRRDLALALFADIGHAAAPAGAAADTRRRFAGAGAGLRYTAAGATPVTMKLDLAHPLAVGGQPARDERTLRLHFSVSMQQSL